jgi:hypothetical protein
MYLRVSSSTLIVAHDMLLPHAPPSSLTTRLAFPS